MVVTAEDYNVLNDACTALDDAGIRYLVGGGTTVTIWGRNRRTKDFDLFLNRDVLRRTMDVLSRADFVTMDTEKRWLYKAWRGEVLVDLIVESRGGVRVDDEEMLHSRMVEQFGYQIRVMGPEDLVYRKALVLTEKRPDWHDAMSVIARQGEAFDWNYFLFRAQKHTRRVLSFLLFARTEMHAPPEAPTGHSDEALYTGAAPGPVPDWVVATLVDEVFRQGPAAPYNPHRLEYLPKAA